jgi:error-prone DNA polymerase
MGFKRSVQKMQAIEQKLRAGLTAHGIVGEAAEEVVRGITSFALYGFPESHAASFALLAYASAYLKAHHPAAFLCALLNAWPMGFYHPATLIKDAQRHGVLVLPIDVVRSEWRSTLERPAERNGTAPAVRLGLRLVRGLREESARRIVGERERSPFCDLADFAARCRPSRQEIETLAALGALLAADGAPEKRRRSALWQVAALPRGEDLLARTAPVGEEADLPPMGPLQETLADYRASGVTTGPHLMAHLRPELERAGILPLEALVTASDGSRVTTAGMVIVRQRPGSAKGFCFLTLEDETGLGNAVLTPSEFARLRTVLHGSSLLIVDGVLQHKDGVIHVRVDGLRPLRAGGPLPPAHDYR